MELSSAQPRARLGLCSPALAELCILYQLTSEEGFSVPSISGVLIPLTLRTVGRRSHAPSHLLQPMRSQSPTCMGRIYCFDVGYSVSNRIEVEGRVRGGVACRKEEASPVAAAREVRRRRKDAEDTLGRRKQTGKVEGICQDQTTDRELSSEEGGQASTGKSENRFLIETSHQRCALLTADHQNPTKLKLSVDPQ